MEYKQLMMKALSKAFILEAPTLFSIKVACYVHIVTFVMFGGVLTSSVVFSIIAMYNVLRIEVTVMFPQAVVALNEVAVSIKRIQASISEICRVFPSISEYFREFAEYRRQMSTLLRYIFCINKINYITNNTS